MTEMITVLFIYLFCLAQVIVWGMTLSGLNCSDGFDIRSRKDFLLLMLLPGYWIFRMIFVTIENFNKLKKSKEETT
jgi:hypothetical protein